MTVGPRRSKDVREETAGVHLRTGREVKDLKDGVAAHTHTHARARAR